MPIQYLKDLLEEFILEYPEFSKIKRSVGITTALKENKNLNDIPLILIEDINVEISNFNLTTEGLLEFNLFYLDIDSKENGYIDLDTIFTNKFIEFICNSNKEITLKNISYFSEEDMIYAVQLELNTYYTF